jgi:hypothetical protein
LGSAFEDYEILREPMDDFETAGMIEARTTFWESRPIKGKVRRQRALMPGRIRVAGEVFNLTAFNSELEA